MRHARWLAALVTFLTSVWGCTSSAGSAPGTGGGDQGPIPPTSPGAGGVTGSGGGSLSTADAEPELGATSETAKDATDFSALEAKCPGVDSSYEQLLTMRVGDAHTMATAGRVREALANNRAPLPSEIRPEDLTNYYHRLSPASPDPKPSLTLQMRQRTVGQYTLDDQFELLVQLDAPKFENRPNVVLTVLVDTGPAMPPAALESAQTLLRTLGKVVLPGDAVTVLTTDPNQSARVVDTTQAESELDQFASGLSASDASDFALGLSRAFSNARSGRVAGAWNRVLYVSNGYAGHSSDISDVAAATTEGVPVLTTVASVGPADGVSDGMLRSMANMGRGAYVHIDTDSEPERLLSERFGELFGILIDNVQVTVRLPWHLSLLDETMSAGVPRPQYLAPGGSMRFLYQVRMCNAELLPKLGSLPIVAEVSGTDPVTGTPHAGGNASRPIQEMLSEVSPPALTELVATRAFIDALRGPTPSRLAEAQKLLESSSGTNTGDEYLGDMLALLKSHPAASQNP